MSEDRLVVLGEEYFETWLRPNLASVGLDLLRRSRDAGHRIVLLSDNLDVVVQPLARHLELDLDDVVCNRMELRGGRATGRLADPVVLPHVAGQWARDFAERRDIDLSISCGYGSAGADSTLLSAIGRPCAVEPDRSLRQIARDLQWPIVRG